MVVFGHGSTPFFILFTSSQLEIDRSYSIIIESTMSTRTHKYKKQTYKFAQERFEVAANLTTCQPLFRYEVDDGQWKGGWILFLSTYTLSSSVKQCSLSTPNDNDRLFSIISAKWDKLYNSHPTQDL